MEPKRNSPEFGCGISDVMPRHQPIISDRCVGGASGTRSPYFEGKIRASPVGSLPGLTRLCLHGAPELGWLTRQSVSTGRGHAGAREAARPVTTLLSSIITTSASHSADFPPAPLFHHPEWLTEFGHRGEEAELPSDGSPGLRELGAHGGHKVNDAGGWTLLPGKDRVQSFSFLACVLMLGGLIVWFFWGFFLQLKASYSGCAPGDCPWHNGKPSHAVVSRCRRRSFQHKMRHLKYF